ncbi:MAG: DUF2974 domain-containing protein, partial [Lachnospiraceae bacterium]|nr:DUF2974 domain-containing protein [Lachnospiraceae bacterium]
GPAGAGPVWRNPPVPGPGMRNAPVPAVYDRTPGQGSPVPAVNFKAPGPNPPTPTADFRSLGQVEWNATMLLLRAMNTERYGGLTLCGYRSIMDTGQDEQMAVVTFCLSDGTDYVAFRGTDTTIVGWKEDFMLSYRRETEGQRHAAAYLDERAAARTGYFYVGGHSKGGNFALYAGAFSAPEVQDRILAVFSNDGPGLREEATREAGFLRILPRVVRIIPEDSVVGILLSNPAGCRVVKSAERGLLQHRGTSWLVRGTHFQYGARSGFSRAFENVIRRWLSELSEEELKDFTEYAFTVLELTGATTVTEIRRDLFGAAMAVFSAADRIPKDKQARFFGMIQQLLRIVLQG